MAARKLRMEAAGGLYHVINRGNYRAWIFETDGAKAAFHAALGQCCLRFRWVLHAYCIMGNHFHLALETPEPNLSEGMRWLQATFANRFNRFQKEKGRLFQGRFKSLEVEDTQRLGWLCHYIHLNPVRAKICRVSELREYGWSSYALLRRPRQRPQWLSFGACLEGAGELIDKTAGWDCYEKYLEWLSEDEPARKRMAFHQMSRGWAIGTKGFRRAVVGDEKDLRTRYKLNQAELRDARELSWESKLGRLLKSLELSSESIATSRKSAPWKIAIATFLRERCGASNGWIAKRIGMGTPFAVSRYATELRTGARPDAARLFQFLVAKVK